VESWCHLLYRQALHVKPILLLAEEVTSGYDEQSIYNPNCSDFPMDDMIIFPPSYYWAVVSQTSLEPDGQTDLFAHACKLHQAPLVRWSCPRTCGCSDVLSGLLYKTAKTGCTMQSCKALPGFKAILDSIEYVELFA